MKRPFGDLWILELLKHNKKLTPKQIYEPYDLDRTSVSKIINRLLINKEIIKIPHPTNKKTYYVQLK